MPTLNASKTICAFNSLSGVMLMSPEVHQVYSDISDLGFKQALMQASHRLTESGKSCCSLGMLKAMGLRWTQALKQPNWLETSEVSLSVSRELSESLSQAMTILLKQQAHSFWSPWGWWYWQLLLSLLVLHLQYPKVVFALCSAYSFWSYNLCFFHHLLKDKADFIQELGIYKPAVNLPKTLARNYTGCTEYTDRVSIKFSNP